MPDAPSDPEPRSITTDAGTVSLTEEGPPEAPALLCVHGLPGSRRDFRYLAPLLAGRFRVVRLEMPGFGDSPADSDTLSGWASALLAASEVVGGKRFYWASHSFGSGALLLAAPRAGGLAGMVLIAPMGLRRHRAFLLPQRAYGLQAWAMGFPPARGAVFALAARVYRAIGLRPPEDWVEVRRHLRILASVDFDAIAAAVGEVRVPALVVHAGDDHMVEAAIARDLHAAMASSELIELPEGGHFLQKTRAAELAAMISARFP